jgi:hypothetical protein
MVEEQDGICDESGFLTLEYERFVVDGKQSRLLHMEGNLP